MDQSNAAIVEISEYILQITSANDKEGNVVLHALTNFGRIFKMTNGYWYEEMSLKPMLKGN